MSKERGFLDYRREEPPYRPKDERVHDYRAVELRIGDEAILRQTARCMDCGTPFCHGCGCPLQNVVPDINDHVYHGRWQAALDILLQTDCFPEFTGRICPALCEGSCVLGINDQPVTIRQIELAVIEHAFENGLVGPKPPAVRLDRRVAVVGSGPAGLAAAHCLNRAGCSVVVYENMAKPGGILRYGIPDFKLEKWVVDRRIRMMEDEGVSFGCSVEVGRDISHRFLASRFDAVLLTGGSRQPRDLPLPGRDLKGIHFAMPFLVQQNMRIGCEVVDPAEAISAEGKRVVVIGGGDTGADCVGTAIRQGAVRVHQFEILPKPPPTRAPETPWPAWPKVLRESSSHKEGCERRWSVMTQAFVGDARGVRQIVCAEVDWVAPPGGGAEQPVVRPGTEFTVDAELVLLAMGFVGPGPNRLVEQLQLRMDPRGNVWRDADGMTSSPGIFVAGDMAQGASLVVRAIADGTRLARRMLAYLARTPAARP